LEECDFLDDICLTVLSASKDVNFSCVVDIHGKLIVGKYRKVDRRLVTTSVDNSGGQYSTSCYLFYVDYLAAAIQRSYFKKRSVNEEVTIAENVEVNFDIIDINNRVKLAITPLTQGKDKFLCVYFVSPLGESYQEIIMKINNTI
jgi:hypothetical protein